MAEMEGFEPSVHGEGTPTHASVTYDPLPASLPGDPTPAPVDRGGSDSSRYGVGGSRYIANLQCLRLSHYAVSNKTRIVIEYRERR
jgi:hypothetical protein